ncbi:MAG: hypothetical protein ABSD71_06685 [Bacteroidales bacterium]|jgi:hypothetical protein
MGIAHGYDNDHAFSPEGVESHPYKKYFPFTLSPCLTYIYIIQPLQGWVFIPLFPMGFTHGYRYLAAFGSFKMI